MTLVFDTETTGLADFKMPAEADCQPRIAQLGMILYDQDWNVRAECNLFVQPFGFDIPIEASRVHGITTEEARRLGLPEPHVLDMFQAMLMCATKVVAHNIKYDTIVMRRAFWVHKKTDPMWLYALYSKAFCTMDAMTNVCCLPGKFDSYKWPTLQEAYTHCFKEPFVGAHDAMADVRACGRIYRWLQENKSSNEPNKTPNK